MPDERDESTADDGPGEPQETTTPAADGGEDESPDISGDGLSYGGSDASDGDGVPDDNTDNESDEAPTASADHSEAERTEPSDDAAEPEDEEVEPEDEAAEPEDDAAEPEADLEVRDESDLSQAELAERIPDRKEGGLPTVDDGGISKPPDDQEMPLADHIEEMISRLAIVLLFAATGTTIGILWASDAIAIIWEQAIPQADEWPAHIYHPLELWLTRIKVAGLLGVMVALPMFVYQCYRFMKPGLYPHERKYYLAAVPTSVVLAAIGMALSYLLVLPFLFEYFTFYSEGSAEIHYALGETFNLVITLTAFLAVVFQIPLLIMMAIMMGVTTRRWLAEKRLYFWAAFAGLAFIFTIDPTAMAAGIVAVIMIILFEGTLLVLKWAGVE
ncbi:twin-arginine translocase subunit TatC [Halovivax gelatinilyticus]|uniref:twin-arginine translocase subunit TatC n=1 Tax=Halovivax gelatinilyticus TaxID=2961597 RepID=UPI0020CA677A|nr:twin-arginine translocase subunit TatC [Halovivax gelatinilyticus]